MDACSVRNTSHQSIKRIDFADEMTFAQSANRRVAGHDTDRFALVCYQCNGGSNAGSCTCSFASGMPATNDDHIKGQFSHGSLYVSRESFANAEFREDHIEEIFDIDATGNPAELISGRPQRIGLQLKSRLI
ncbi:hypothetical protein D3C80_211570 [compost metagenome]